MNLKLCCLLFPLSVLGSQLDLNARYEASSSNRDVAAQTVLFQTEVIPELTAKTGVRLSRVWADTHALDYAVGAGYQPVDFFSLETRLNHAQRFRAGTSSSHLVLLASVHPRLASVTVFLRTGWYERFLSLREVSVPFFSSSAREHDWIGAFGFVLPLAETWRFQAQIATFEEISVFNLNNPFLEARVARDVEDWKVTLEAFFRYQLLLGFGRWDRLVGGLGIRFSI